MSKRILDHRESLGSDTLEASLILRYSLDAFDLRPGKWPESDLEDPLYDHVSRLWDEDS